MQPKELSLLVLKVVKLEETKSFYETLGFSFSKHQHGNGPLHYCSEVFGFAFELYPSSIPHKNFVCLGFCVNEIATYRTQLVERGFFCSEITETEFGISFHLRDPENNRIEVYNER